MSEANGERAVTVERRGHVLLMGLNRPEKRNAFNLAMLGQLAYAYKELEEDDELRCGVVFAHGDHFTAGLDLEEVGTTLADGGAMFPPDTPHPWRLDDLVYTKPVVAAAQGWCMTLGIELLLACDIRVASSKTRFAQLEVQRGIYPFGGGTIRLPREAGWGNAMRWLLTGDRFDAQEAYRIGVVQEVTEPGQQVERAIDIAERIATRCAPLGVRATLASAQRAMVEGERAAMERLDPDVIELLGTEDGVEGMRSFVERRAAKFAGR
jgi:enoyl-CoA hydratase